MNMKEYAFGIDLGGTTAKVGLFTTAGALLEKWEVPTDTSNAGEHILGNLAKAVKDKMQENGITAEQVEGVGVGVPGPVLDSRIVPIVCANLGGWGERNVSIQLSGLLDGIKVLVGNDADVAALGEIWMGCAKGCRSAVMVTLGTGVGGGAFIDGRIYSGYNYSALEVGHMVIRQNGRKCNCGRRGCFERYASAAALAKDTAAAMKKHPESLMWQVCPDIKNVNAQTAFDAMRMGDVTGEKLVRRYVEYLACGLVNLINIFQPEVICLGGGVSNEKEFLLDLLKPYIDREDFAHNARERVTVKIAKFRNDAGIIGAAMLGVNNA